MLWLNPSDNQGVRFLIDDIRGGTASAARSRAVAHPTGLNPFRTTGAHADGAYEMQSDSLAGTTYEAAELHRPSRCLDILVVANANDLLFKGPRPRYGAASEAAVQDQELAPLLQSCAPLDQRSGRVAGLDDDCRLAQSRHGLVPLREKEPIVSNRLSGVPQHGDQRRSPAVVSGDLFLQLGVLGGYTAPSGVPMTAMVRPPCSSAAW